ncbi:hypothetical protein MHU86_1169 [Fragilaria crotonensis]|nr:hypothetical protein MHU86_1169 [Fragilaria crotonensis]
MEERQELDAMMLGDSYTNQYGNDPSITKTTTSSRVKKDKSEMTLDEKQKKKEKKKKKKNKKSSKSESKQTSSTGSHSLQDSSVTKTTAGSTVFVNSSPGESTDIDHTIWPLDQEHQWDATTKCSDVASIGGFSHNEALWAGLRADQTVVSATGESVDPRKVFTKIDRQERSKRRPSAKHESVGSQSDGSQQQLLMSRPPVIIKSQPKNQRRENRHDARRRAYRSSGITETITSNVGEVENEPDPLVQYLVSMGFDHGDAELVSDKFVLQRDSRTSVQTDTSSQPSDESSSSAASRKFRNLHSSLPAPEYRTTQSRRSLQHSLHSEDGDIENCNLGEPMQREPESGVWQHDLDVIPSATPEAIPVMEDSSNKWPIIYADSGPLSLMHAMKDRNLRRFILLGILILVAAVTTTTVVLLRRNSGGVAASTEALGPTISPSSSPTFINDDILNEAAKISGWDALNQADSPQMKAVGWMSSLDETDLDEFGTAFVQRYCLVVFYFSTGGPNWLNQHSWLDPKLHACSWGEGTSCFPDGSNQLIFIGLDETRNGLSGSLPVELGFLSETVFLRLSKNDIGGSIPSEIGKLKRLSTLDLSSNMITGSIPDTIGDAADLVQLDLSYNRINGTIPSSFYNLVRLHLLRLSFNEITGPIEADVGNLKDIATFDVRNNKLSGTVTTGFDQLKAADVIWMDYNKFSGPIPPLSEVMASRLEMTFSHNDLTGTIPVADVLRRHLQDVEESYRFRIQKIDLSYNRLSGTINPVSGYLPTLRYADFSGNNFTGQFPGDNGWSGIEFLGIANNNFTGTLPSGWPRSLSHLDVANNSLTGGIPTELCNFPGLKLLGLGGNSNLTATLPTCLFELPLLQNLNLASINLEGTIPTQIGMLTLLEYLDVSGNSLTGTIPSETGLCSNLAAIDLSSNQLGGGIPSDLGQLHFLKSFNVGENDLVGSLPQEFGELQGIEHISLRGNDLTGSIPEGLCLTETNWSSVDIGCGIECRCCVTTGKDSC